MGHGYRYYILSYSDIYLYIGTFMVIIGKEVVVAPRVIYLSVPTYSVTIESN